MATSAYIVTDKFPELGTVILMPKVCPGRPEEQHEPHPFMSHGMIERVEQDRGFVIVRDDYDFETHKILVQVQ